MKRILLFSVVGGMIALASCGGGPSAEEKAALEQVAIGQQYQGGIVAYLLQPEDIGYDANIPHGIIAAPTYQSSDAEWGCFKTKLLGGTQRGIGYGAANTAAIVNGCAEAGIAARICDELVLNGYDDWYLPSIDELELLYKYLHVNGIGDFGSAFYWSSTEYNEVSDTTLDEGFASLFRGWPVYKYGGSAYNGSKGRTAYVRAVRAF